MLLCAWYFSLFCSFCLPVGYLNIYFIIPFWGMYSVFFYVSFGTALSWLLWYQHFTSSGECRKHNFKNSKDDKFSKPCLRVEAKMKTLPWVVSYLRQLYYKWGKVQGSNVSGWGGPSLVLCRDGTSGFSYGLHWYLLGWERLECFVTAPYILFADVWEGWVVWGALYSSTSGGEVLTLH